MCYVGCQDMPFTSEARDMSTTAIWPKEERVCWRKTDATNSAWAHTVWWPQALRWRTAHAFIKASRGTFGWIFGRRWCTSICGRKSVKRRKGAKLLQLLLKSWDLFHFWPSFCLEIEMNVFLMKISLFIYEWTLVPYFPMIIFKKLRTRIYFSQCERTTWEENIFGIFEYSHWEIDNKFKYKWMSSFSSLINSIRIQDIIPFKNRINCVKEGWISQSICHSRIIFFETGPSLCSLCVERHLAKIQAFTSGLRNKPPNLNFSFHWKVCLRMVSIRPIFERIVSQGFDHSM